MNRKSMILAAGLLATAGAVAAMAAVGRHGYGFGHGLWGQGGHGIEGLRRRDADNDGAVTADEFVKPRAERFAALDANMDRVVDAQEIAVPMKERAAYWVKRFMKRLDQNSDGKISQEEFERGPKARFSERDLNGDGKITAEDLPPGAMRRSGRRGGDWGGSEKGGRGLGPKSLEGTLERTAAAFKKRDANADGFIDEHELAADQAERLDFATKKAMHAADHDRDGKITQDEFTRRARERFAVLDLNDDGRITSDDFPPSARWRWNKQLGGDRKKGAN